MTSLAAAPRPPAAEAGFHEAFVAGFDPLFGRVFRVLDRLAGDPDVAEDLAQEAMVRLYRRGALPDDPSAWVVSVGLNLFRNHATRGRRRAELLTAERGARSHSDAPPDPQGTAAASEARVRVRSTLDRLPRRHRELLILRAEGYRYGEIAGILGIGETSVGTLLARARRDFRQAWEAEP